MATGEKKRGGKFWPTTSPLVRCIRVESLQNAQDMASPIKGC